MARRRRRALRRAELATQLRYGPEIRGLQTIMREIRSNLKQGVRAERGSAEGIMAAAEAARPALRQVYSQAGHQADVADADMQMALSGLGSTADPYKAVAASESAAAQGRLLEAGARAEQDLVSRKVGAQEGAQFAIRNLQSQARQDTRKVRQQGQDLAKEAGLFQANEFESALDAETKLDLERGRLRVQRQSAAETRRQNRIDQQQKDEDQQLEREKEARMREQERYDRKHGGKDGKGGGPSEATRRNAHEQWEKGKHLADNLAKNPKSKNASAGKWVDFLMGEGIDTEIARGVVQLRRSGGVAPGVRRKLHRRYGLKPRLRGTNKSPPLLAPFIGPNY